MRAPGARACARMRAFRARAKYAPHRGNARRQRARPSSVTRASVCMILLCHGTKRGSRMKHSFCVQSAENTPRFGSVACARPKKRARFARCAFACGRRRRAAIKMHPPRAGARAHAPRHGRGGARTVRRKGRRACFRRALVSRAPTPRDAKKNGSGNESRRAGQMRTEDAIGTQWRRAPAGRRGARGPREIEMRRAAKKKKNAACVPTSRPRHAESSSKDIARAHRCVR